MAIIIEASLGFLGVGIPAHADGAHVADALNSGTWCRRWLVLFPGAAITLTVLAFNLLGDGCATYWTRGCVAHYRLHPSVAAI